MGKHIKTPQIERILSVITTIFCILNLYNYYYALMSLADSELSFYMGIVFIATFVLPPFIFECKNSFKSLLFRLIPSIICYIVAMPMYSVVFQAFAYANLHDVSWGNRDAANDQKQDPKKKEREIERQKEYELTRLKIFSVWIIVNITVGYCISIFSSESQFTWIL